MKKILFILLTLFSANVYSQSEFIYPYNPDSDTDGYISATDLLDLLGVYGYAFVPAEIYIDGVPMGEIIVNLESLLNSEFVPGNETGEFLRWNNQTSEWEPELILNDLQINDVTVYDGAAFMSGISVTGNVGVDGIIGVSSVVVESDLMAGSTSLQDLTVSGNSTIGGNISVVGSADVSSLNVSGASSLNSLNTSGNSTINGVLTVNGNTNLSQLNAEETTLNNLSVSGDADVSGTLEANTFQPQKIAINNVSLNVSQTNSNNYPLKLEGSKQGVWIDLSPINGSADNGTSVGVDGDQNFITFASNGTPVGRVEGNRTIASLDELINSVMSEIDGSASASFIESCMWTMNTQHNVSTHDDGCFLFVYVQRGAASCFPSEYRDGYGSINYDGIAGSYIYSAYGADIDDNGNCINNDCWQRGKLPITYGSNSAVNFFVPENRNIRLDFVGGCFANVHDCSGNAYTCIGDPSCSSPSLNFNWSLIKPDGNTAHSGSLSENIVDFGLEPSELFGSGSVEVSTGTSCPSVSEEGAASAIMNNPNSNDISECAINGNIVAIVDEIVMIADWAKSITELVMAIWPPGVPFDAWDIFDASFGVVTSSWGVASYYSASCNEVLPNGGVAFASSGADYAEWLEKSDVRESLVFGDIVGVREGKLSKRYIDADHYMVISSQPIILGNMPDMTEENSIGFEKVAFLGQVPVKVRGKVHPGDYIITSGYGDGIGIAVNPEEMKTLDYNRIVGVAWEGAEKVSSLNYSLINTAIGLNRNDLAGKVDELQSAIVKIEAMLSLIDETYEPTIQSDGSVLSSSVLNKDELETIRPNFPSGMTNSEIEYLELMSGIQELTSENRIAIGNALDKITKEQMGISIQDDYPIIYRIVTDETYATHIKGQMEILLGKINNSMKELSKDANNSRKKG